MRSRNAFSIAKVVRRLSRRFGARKIGERLLIPVRNGGAPLHNLGPSVTDLYDFEEEVANVINTAEGLHNWLVHRAGFMHEGLFADGRGLVWRVYRLRPHRRPPQARAHTQRFQMRLEDVLLADSPSHRTRADEERNTAWGYGANDQPAIGDCNCDPEHGSCACNGDGDNGPVHGDYPDIHGIARSQYELERTDAPIKPGHYPSMEDHGAEAPETPPATPAPSETDPSETSSTESDSDSESDEPAPRQLRWQPAISWEDLGPHTTLLAIIDIHYRSNPEIAEAIAELEGVLAARRTVRPWERLGFGNTPAVPPNPPVEENAGNDGAAPCVPTPSSVHLNCCSCGNWDSSDSDQSDPTDDAGPST